MSNCSWLNNTKDIMENSCFVDLCRTSGMYTLVLWACSALSQSHNLNDGLDLNKEYVL